MSMSIRKVGPVNINSSYAGLLRISPNIYREDGGEQDMGLADIASLGTGAEGFADGLGWVSDSNGTYSCLSLGIAAAKVDGLLTIGSEGENTPEILKVYGGGAFSGDIASGGTVSAQKGVFANSIEGGANFVLHGPRIDFIPGEGDSSFARTYIDLSATAADSILFCTENGGFEPLPLSVIYDLIAKVEERLESLEGRFDTRYVRQDEVNSVQRISSVTEYPANPDAFTLYLKREK